MRARVIAFYLPQFHPIPENDQWWGKGFTEWTNVAKAKPLFKGHHQPHIPADLGFYDLRMPEIREQQAELAKEAGIEGFCYWHYWFGKGKRLLERPFNEVLESGKPNYPFCLGWANESWSNRSWNAKSKSIKDATLMEQTYIASEYEDHFYEVLPAFRDSRYITVDEKPLFVVFSPYAIPDLEEFIRCWRKLAEKNGLKGIHFVGITNNISLREIGSYNTGTPRVPSFDEASLHYTYLLNKGFDAVNSRGQLRAEMILGGKYKMALKQTLANYLKIDLLMKYDQSSINKELFVKEDSWENAYPTIIPNWDRSPRSGRKAIVYTNSTPDVFEKQVKDALALVKDKKKEHKIIFLKSWNEWGEGNFMEPDLEYGHGYLDALKRQLLG
jgi:hypothetical protein